MKKIEIITLNQKNKEFYMFKCDPRSIIRLVDIPKEHTSQDAQRPWSKNRVLDIASYVAGETDLSDSFSLGITAKGIIPTCPILNIREPFKIIIENGLKYLLLPEDTNEISSFFGNIEILDGQHRLISFSDEYIKAKFDNTNYEMGFIAFWDLDLDSKRELFMVTNDKQEKVEPNVLRQIKKWLKLLSEEQDVVFNIIENLNINKNSPLKNRIIIGGESVPKGFKLTQVSKIISISKIYELLKSNSLDNQVSIIINYLNAWKNVYPEAVCDPKKNHVLSKIAGLRYMCFMFQYVFEISKYNKKTLTEDNITSILRIYFKNTNGYSFFNDPDVKLAFRGESGTIALAKREGLALKDKIFSNEEIFDPTNI